MAWTNSDGLRVRFGLEEGVTQKAYEIPSEDGLFVTTVFTVDYTDFCSAAALVSDTVTIPNGARIHSVQTEAETAFTGSGFVYNVGLIDQDRSTAIDLDGLLAVAPLADVDATGEFKEYVVGSTYAGALIGTVLTNTGLLCIDYDTAAPTAGRLTVRVRWYKPNVVQ